MLAVAVYLACQHKWTFSKKKIAIWYYVFVCWPSLSFSYKCTSRISLVNIGSCCCEFLCIDLNVIACYKQVFWILNSEMYLTSWFVVTLKFSLTNLCRWLPPCFSSWFLLFYILVHCSDGSLLIVLLRYYPARYLIVCLFQSY